MNRSARQTALVLTVALCAAGAWAACGGGACGKGACGSAEKAKMSCGADGACASKTAAKEAKAEEHATSEKAALGHVDTGGVKALLAAKADVKLLDARSGKYDDGRRLPGAVALAPDAEAEAIQKVVSDKEQLIVVYCSNLKCPASKMLGERLLELGYRNVVKYPEGIDGWVEAGHSVEKAG